MLALYTGTALNVSYLLSGVAALLIAVAMLRRGIFGTITAYVGIALIARALRRLAGGEETAA